MSGSLETPSVGVVLLNWNTYPETEACLSSLEKATYKNFDVVVVDNASQDESLKKIESEFSWVETIRNETNRGFAGGCNTGIEHYRQRDYDYVLLLNNDTIVEPEFIQPLVDTAETHDRVAGVSSVIEYKDEEGIWFAGGRFDSTLVKWYRQTSVKSDNPYETGFITGAAFLIPMNIVESLGLFNDRFFFGGEDQEYVYRAKQNGWRFFVAPKSVISHEIGAASDTGSPFKFYHATRNRLLFSKLHHTPSQRLQFHIFFVMTRLFRFFQWGFTGETDRIRAVASGISDTVCGKPAKKPSELGITP